MEGKEAELIGRIQKRTGNKDQIGNAHGCSSCGTKN
jgi:hypothetical protein